MGEIWTPESKKLGEIWTPDLKRGRYEPRTGGVMSRGRYENAPEKYMTFFEMNCQTYFAPMMSVTNDKHDVTLKDILAGKRS